MGQPTEYHLVHLTAGQMDVLTALMKAMKKAQKKAHRTGSVKVNPTVPQKEHMTALQLVQ